MKKLLLLLLLSCFATFATGCAARLLLKAVSTVAGFEKKNELVLVWRTKTMSGEFYRGEATLYNSSGDTIATDEIEKEEYAALFAAEESQSEFQNAAARAFWKKRGVDIDPPAASAADPSPIKISEIPTAGFH